MTNEGIPPFPSQSDNAGPSSLETQASSRFHEATGGAFASTAFDTLALETIDSTSTPESQQVWFGRKFQADFVASLPGVKHIRRIVQGA